MEKKDEKSTSVNGSAYTLTFESFEVYLKMDENTSIVDKRVQRLESCKSTERIKSSSSKSECSRLCAEYKKISSNGLQTSDCKPQTLRESPYRQKEPETKPAGEMPLFDHLKTKMKETSRKLQSALPFFKKTVGRTVARARSLYAGLKPKRALGFKCDLKKCESALMDCSAGACRKKGMIFGEPSQHPSTSRTIDSSVSDISTVSNTSEDTF